MSSVRPRCLSPWDQEDALWEEVLLGSRPAFMQLLGLSLRPMLNYYLRSVPGDFRHQIDPYDLRQKACVQIVVGFERFQPSTLAAYHVWRKCIERRVLARALRGCGAHEDGSAARPARLDERAIGEGGQGHRHAERDAYDTRGCRSPLEAMIAAETGDAVRAAIDLLPDADRELFLWHARDRASFVEIAHRLGVTKNHTWRRYLTIRRQLAKQSRETGS
jgi:RNA polymerase sigma factor (sigma-70 family)